MQSAARLSGDGVVLTVADNTQLAEGVAGFNPKVCRTSCSGALERDVGPLPDHLPRTLLGESSAQCVIHFFCLEGVLVSSVQTDCSFIDAFRASRKSLQSSLWGKSSTMPSSVNSICRVSQAVVAPSLI